MKEHRIVTSLTGFLFGAVCALMLMPGVMAQEVAADAGSVGVEYRGHIQDYGDQPANAVWVQGPDQLGTTGESKRIEGFRIRLTGNDSLPTGVSIRYNVHVENVGWLAATDLSATGSWLADGVFAGSEGRSQRVEAIQIVLTGADGKALPGYSVEYLVHGQDYGWTQGWQADGAIAGTISQSKRLEAIQIRIVRSEAGAALDTYSALQQTVIGLKPADYTAATWAVLQTAITENVVDETNTADQIKAAGAAIQKAVDGLMKKSEPVVYNAAGTYGPDQDTQTIAGDVTVAADGVILQNLVIQGDLTISEAVGSGTVTLNNVRVDGDTFVRGGGVNSIKINGGQYSRIVMEKTASGAVRIVAKDVDGLDVVISEDATGQTIILEGTFASVVVNAPNMTVTTQGNTTTIGTMTVGVGAGGSTLNLAYGTTVANLVLNAKTAVKGQGTVKEATVAADRVTYERAPISQTVASGVVIPPVIISQPSGGGSSGPVTVPVSGVSLNKTAMTLLVNGKETLTAIVVPTGASNKAVSWTSSDAAVATVDASTGEVTAVAEGTAEITATSTYDSAKKATGLVTVKSNVLVPELNGITIPFAGDHPVMAITETDQYSGTVTWKQDDTTLTADSVFDGSKRYTATITISLKPPYAAAMISSNYFTVAGATVYNNNQSTTVMAAFLPIAQYRVNETGTLTAYSGPGGVLAVPDNINLTGIGDAAFTNKNLTEISLPDAVQTVAGGAFAGNTLTKITLGAGVDIVDDTAMGVNGASFKTAYDTESGGVSKQKGNYSFSNGAWHYSGNQVDQLWFDAAGLVSAYTGTSKTLMIPDGQNITAIAPQALAARGIKTLSLPDTVKTVGDGAFKDNSITDITIGPGVTVGADNALGTVTDSFLAAYHSNADKAGNYRCYFEIVYGTPNWYYSDFIVNGMAFNTATQTINSYAGSGGNLTIPANIDGTVVKTILDNSFRSKNITGLVFDSGSQLTTIKAGAFCQNPIPAVTLPDTVKTVEGSAFQSCHISSLTLSSSLTTIELAAFMSNELSEITIPDSVTSIGQQAFVSNKLTKVVIEGTGDGNLTIGKGAFQAFTQADSNPITEITIPDKVTISDEDGLVAMGKYGAAFKSLYDDPTGNNQIGGTFTYDIGTAVWTKN